ncbi:MULTISPECIES: hypothetical protein [Okeania]|uniref:hypothetical protein n=1 Tax=Okeania TaxID=1458928 RepID=UPI000F5371B2|nr:MULTISPECIES: hypothetical protein [Okeania]NES93230.1 hypothetical protein [Okeania sp. SIO2B9]
MTGLNRKALDELLQAFCVQLDSEAIRRSATLRERSFAKNQDSDLWEEEEKRHCYKLHTSYF